ncbi:hypothetical protein GCM10022393_08090 [Aquimarina addita]|uniref:Secretion system C-terminal sorting domain-containing protein n=1 Tax=Aquimarina addita TaxID=870485 RepID=A0ABP7XBS5_9FLAO
MQSIENEKKVQRFFYNDSVTAIQRWFGKGNKVDSLYTFYKSGNLNEVFYYNSKRKFHGTAVQYDPQGDKIVSWQFDNGKLIRRINHKLVYNKNNEDIRKKMYKSLDSLNQLLQSNPESVKNNFYRGRLRVSLRNNTLGLQDFHKLLKFMNQSKMNKDSKTYRKRMSSIHDYLGMIYGEYENEDKAIHHKLLAIYYAEKKSRLEYNLGSYLYSIKFYRLAITYLEKAKKDKPKHSFANMSLGALYSDLGEYEKAMRCINIAYEKQASINKWGVGDAQKDVRSIRGLIFHKLGESKKGIADLEEALDINKNNAFAMRNLGVIYHDLGQYEEACQLLQKSDSLNYKKQFDRDDLQNYLEASCSGTSLELSENKITLEPYVYPNPTVDISYIKNFEYQNFEYEVYDYQFKLVKKGSSIDGSISIKKLESGLYTIKVLIPEFPQTFLIVKD